MGQRPGGGRKVDFNGITRTIDPAEDAAALVATESITPLNRRLIGLRLSNTNLLDQGSRLGNKKSASFNDCLESGNPDLCRSIGKPNEAVLAGKGRFLKGDPGRCSLTRNEGLTLSVEKPPGDGDAATCPTQIEFCSPFHATAGGLTVDNHVDHVDRSSLAGCSRPRFHCRGCLLFAGGGGNGNDPIRGSCRDRSFLSANNLRHSQPHVAADQPAPGTDPKN